MKCRICRIEGKRFHQKICDDCRDKGKTIIDADILNLQREIKDKEVAISVRKKKIEKLQALQSEEKQIDHMSNAL